MGRDTDEAARLRAEAASLRAAMREVQRRASLPITPNVSGTPDSPETLRAAIAQCCRLAVDHVAEPARALLSGEPAATKPAPHVPEHLLRTDVARCAECGCGWEEGTYDEDCGCPCHTDPSFKPVIEPGRQREPAPERARRTPKKWNGLCPAGKHGLDYPGQPCDLCPKEPTK